MALAFELQQQPIVAYVASQFRGDGLRFVVDSTRPVTVKTKRRDGTVVESLANRLVRFRM